MSVHRLTFPPKPQRRRFHLDSYASIALAVGAVAVIAVAAIVFSLVGRTAAATPPQIAPAQLQAVALQPAAYAQGQLLYEIRAEAFRAGYQAAIEREACASGAPITLGMPVGQRP